LKQISWRDGGMSSTLIFCRIPDRYYRVVFDIKMGLLRKTPKYLYIFFPFSWNRKSIFISRVFYVKHRKLIFWTRLPWYNWRRRRDKFTYLTFSSCKKYRRFHYYFFVKSNFMYLPYLEKRSPVQIMFYVMVSFFLNNW